MKRNFIIILLLMFTGCELLTTRDPEDPNSARSNYVAATSPDILFQNLKESFSEKIVENYMACFVDQSFLEVDYLFVPSAGSVSQFNVLSDWTLDLERQYFNNVKSLSEPDVPIELQLNNQISNPSSESALYQFDYILTLSTNDASIPTNYEGSVQFKINLDSRQIWVITEWYDTGKENFPSWSELRGGFIKKNICIFFLSFILNGCVNPFAPTLDNDLSNEGSLISDLSEVNGVFQNFQYAYTFKDTTIYGGLLAPDFLFSYRDYERGVDVSWSREEELRVSNGLFQNSQRLDLIWNNIVSMTADSTRIIRSFNLTITFNPTDIIFLDGRVNLSLRKENHKWQIIQWIDESNF